MDFLFEGNFVTKQITARNTRMLEDAMGQWVI